MDFDAGAFPILRLAGAFVTVAGLAFAATVFDAAAAAFLAGAVLAGAALADAGGQTPLASLGAAEGLITASLKPLRAVILAFLDAFTLTAAPVAGLRAMRAGLSTRANLAKPMMVTCSPLAATASITSVVPRNALSTSRASRPV